MLPFSNNNIPILLEALELGVSDEFYLIDASSMQIEYASDSVQKNTGYDLTHLKQQSLENLLGVCQQTLQEYMSHYRHHIQLIDLAQSHRPIVGNVNHNQLRAMLVRLDSRDFILIIKNYAYSVSTSECINCGEKSQQLFNKSESRFRNMVANIPGLFFQFQLNANVEFNFTYLSDKCGDVLGLSPEMLKKHPGLFYEMMNARDLALLRESLELSSIELTPLNWEGRVWIDDWQDTKWINIRAMPRSINNSVIQWEGIMTNITQSKQAKLEIEQSRRDLAELSAHMRHIKEQERCKIAREIHDDLGGNLTAIKIGLSSIIDRLGPDQKVLVALAQNLETIVDNTFEAVHRISSDLRPNVLELGIVAALEWQSKQFENQLGIHCDFSCSQPEISATPTQEIALFRICQESMSNIAKHAKATHVNVSLSAEANELVMTISDDGVGIKPDDMLKVNSFGLRGMRERVTALNGRLTVAELSSRQGASINIRLPIEL